MTTLEFEHFEALTFDCYGTLIDWESGILTALRELLGDRGADASDEALLSDFGRFESKAEQGAFRSYRQVLRSVAGRFAEAYVADAGEDARASFAESVTRWPPFSDTVVALEALSARYRLAIVSNVDDDLFVGSAAQLSATFAEVVTAQQVQSYKPAREHFDEALRRLDLPTDRVLHVAQSLHHDIAPAKALGFSCVWVNRRAGRKGGGATPPSSATPDLEVPSLSDLVRQMGLG